jgi:sugar-specific transcriptional regulator TrmB
MSDKIDLKELWNNSQLEFWESDTSKATLWNEIPPPLRIYVLDGMEITKEYYSKEAQSLRSTITSLETAFNEARKEVKEAEKVITNISREWDEERKRYKEQLQRANELQAEVERLRGGINMDALKQIVRDYSRLRNNEIRSQHRSKHLRGIDEVFDVQLVDSTKILDHICPHWQPKEGE